VTGANRRRARSAAVEGLWKSAVMVGSVPIGIAGVRHVVGSVDEGLRDEAVVGR
jgi:hypothetical protein